jgi:hypothetical protein
MVCVQAHRPNAPIRPYCRAGAAHPNGCTNSGSAAGSIEVAWKSKYVHTKFSLLLYQQLHWSDYSTRAYITALQHLHALQSPSNRLINALGLCNFDSARTDEICTALGPGVIVSNQIQVLLSPTAIRRSCSFPFDPSSP